MENDMAPLLTGVSLILTALTPIMLAVIGLFAAREAREVKATLAETTAKTDQTLREIHDFVNGNVTESMSRELIALRAWALSISHTQKKGVDSQELLDLREQIRTLASEIKTRKELALQQEGR